MLKKLYEKILGSEFDNLLFQLHFCAPGLSNNSQGNWKLEICANIKIPMCEKKEGKPFSNPTAFGTKATFVSCTHKQDLGNKLHGCKGTRCTVAKPILGDS